MSPQSPSLLSLCGRILRTPGELVDSGSDRQVLGRLAPQLLVVSVGAAVVFGAVVGSYRGGEQIAFAAVKMPLLFLVPLLVALPATAGLLVVCGLRPDPARLGVAGLVGMARTALIAAAAAPVLWLCYSLSPGYHLATAVLAATLLLAGLTGLPALLEAVSERSWRARAATLAGMLLLGLTIAQTGWVLRPFVARPRAEVTMLRPVEGDVLGSLARVPLAAAQIFVEYEPRKAQWRGSGEDRIDELAPEVPGRSGREASESVRSTERPVDEVAP
jgi:hypothetical protein